MRLEPHEWDYRRVPLEGTLREPSARTEVSLLTYPKRRFKGYSFYRYS